MVIELKGSWWIPGKKRKKVEGSLIINPSKNIVLKTDKILVEDYTEIINGKDYFNHNITLYQCYEESTTVYPKGEEAKVRCDFAFIGEKFEESSSIKFKNIWVKFSNLNSWMEINKLNIEKNADSGFFIRGEIDYEYLVSLPEGNKISFYSNLTPPIIDSGKDIIFKRNTNVCFSFKETKELKTCIEFILDIRNFLSFGLLSPVYPINIFGGLKKNKKTTFIDIYCSMLGSSTNSNSYITRPEILFTLKDVQDKFSKILINWFEKKPILKFIADGYYGFISSNEIYFENNFLNLTRLIEGYHRAHPNYNDNEIDNNIYNEKKKNVLRKFKSKEDLGLGIWIDDIFGRYGNIKSFKSRLKELFDTASIILDFISDNDKEEFIKKTNKMRNYLTHPKDPKRTNTNEKTLGPMISKLEILLLICILLDVEFENSKLKYNLSNKTRLRHYYNDNNWSLTKN